MPDIFEPVTSYAEIVERFSQFLIHNNDADQLKPNPESIFLVRQEWHKLTMSYVKYLLKKFERSGIKRKVITYKKGEE